MENMQGLEEIKSERWKIKDDSDAEWWLEKKNDEMVEIRRLKMSIENRIKVMQEKLKEVKEEESELIKNRDFYLQEYFESVEDKQRIETKTQIKYRLPSAELVFKKPREQFIRNDVALVEWLNKNKLEQFIKVKKSPDWANLKKQTTVVGNTVVTINGEIVEGIEVELTAPTFEVRG